MYLIPYKNSNKTNKSTYQRNLKGNDKGQGRKIQ